jgi:hypothetical protein
MNTIGMSLGNDKDELGHDGLRIDARQTDSLIS